MSSLLTLNTFNTFSQRFYYCFKQVNVFWEKKFNLVRIAKRWNSVSNFIEIALWHGCSPVNIWRAFQSGFSQQPEVQTTGGINLSWRWNMLRGMMWSDHYYYSSEVLGRFRKLLSLITYKSTSPHENKKALNSFYHEKYFW